MKKYVDQSSRLYYKRKDHKDVYYQQKFHGALYMKDKDESVADLLWRKMFRDRYFIYHTGINFGDSYDGKSGVCYTKEKINSGCVNTGKRIARINDNYSVLNSDTTWLDISSKDEKFYKVNDLDTQASFIQGYRNGVLCRNGNGGRSFLKFKDCNLPSKEFDSSEQVFSSSGWLDLFTAPNGESIFGIARNSSADIPLGSETDQAWRVWNSVTYTTNNFYVRIAPTYTQGQGPLLGNMSVVGANQKTFIVYEETEKQSGYIVKSKLILHEVGAEGIVAHHSLPYIDGRVQYLSVGLVYSNSTYYMYVTYRENVTNEFRNTVFSSEDLTEWLEHSLPNKLTIPHIDSDNALTIWLNTTVSGHSVSDVLYAHNISNNAFPIFEDNERIKASSDMAFRWNANIIYLDNHLFNYSGNNFYFTVYDAVNGNDQAMWRKYYNLD